jgi:hypothetical protein
MIVAVYVAIILMIVRLIAKLAEVAVGIYGKRKEKGQYRGDTSKELVLNILKDLNCQPIEEDDRTIFTYQNKQFSILPYHTSLFAIISHLGYLDLDSSTEEDVLKLKETVNEYNAIHYFPTLVYILDKEKKTLDIHACLSTVFSQEIIDLKDLFVAYLDSFFEARTTSLEQFHLKIKEKEEGKRIVVKGFTPIEDNEDKLEEKNE